MSPPIPWKYVFFLQGESTRILLRLLLYGLLCIASRCLCQSAWMHILSPLMISEGLCADCMQIVARLSLSSHSQLRV